MLFRSDQGNNRVRKVVFSGGAGTITTLAGTGTAGFNGDTDLITGLPLPSSAQLKSPAGVAVDGAGNVFIADYGNNRIRRVDASGTIIVTAAGTGVAGFFGDGGVSTSAQLNAPAGVTVTAAGDFFIADLINQTIRKVGLAP